MERETGPGGRWSWRGGREREPALDNTDRGWKRGGKGGGGVPLPGAGFVFWRSLSAIGKLHALGSPVVNLRVVVSGRGELEIDCSLLILFLYNFGLL